MKINNYSSEIEKVLISEHQILQRTSEIAKQVCEDYQGKRPLLVCILKGSVIFFADLIKNIDMDLDIDFMAISSYGNNVKTSGEVKMIKDLCQSINGRDVLVVEDIIDSGLTISFLKKQLQGRGANVKVCTLLDKPQKRKVEIKADYVGFEIEDYYVVGYGMDYAERFRNLKEVCILNKSVYENKEKK